MYHLRFLSPTLVGYQNRSLQAKGVNIIITSISISHCTPNHQQYSWDFKNESPACVADGRRISHQRCYQVRLLGLQRASKSPRPRSLKHSWVKRDVLSHALEKRQKVFWPPRTYQPDRKSYWPPPRRQTRTAKVVPRRSYYKIIYLQQNTASAWGGR